MASPPSATANRVVVALLDGRRLKGFVYGFDPQGGGLNVFDSPNATSRSHATLVEFPACKAIFFVKSHEGSREGRDAEREAGADPKRRAPLGAKVRIIFADGEEMMACTEAYSPQKLGFFVYPLDPRSNNTRIYIVNANVRQVLTGKSIDSGKNAPPDRERVAKLAPPGPPSPFAAPASDAATQDLKCEAALRVLNGDSPADLEAEYGIPAAVISFWTRTFLQSGRASLGASEAMTVDSATDGMLAEMHRRIRDLTAEVERLKAAPGRRSR